MTIDTAAADLTEDQEAGWFEGAKYGLLTGWVTAVLVNVVIGLYFAVEDLLFATDNDGPLELFYFFVVGGLTVGGIIGALIGLTLGSLFGITGSIRYAKFVMPVLCAAPAIFYFGSDLLDAIELHGTEFRTITEAGSELRTASMFDRDILVFLARSFGIVVAAFAMGCFAGRLFIQSVQQQSLVGGLRSFARPR